MKRYIVNPDYFFSGIRLRILENIFSKIDFVWEALKSKNIYLEGIEEQMEGEVDKTTIIKGKVSIGKKTVIEPYCVIEGPTIIGESCYIRPHCYIRAGTIIGNDVTIGHGVEIKNSIIFDECKLDTHSFVGDSILGFGVRNGSGTITANRRFNQKNITIKIDGEEYETGCDKLGCIVGDYSRIGANCTIAPGAIIGQHVWIYPNSFIRGFIQSDTLVKLQQKFTNIPKERLILKQYDKMGKR